MSLLPNLLIPLTYRNTLKHLVDMDRAERSAFDLPVMKWFYRTSYSYCHAALKFISYNRGLPRKQSELLTSMKNSPGCEVLPTHGRHYQHFVNVYIWKLCYWSLEWQHPPKRCAICFIYRWIFVIFLGDLALSIFTPSAAFGVFISCGVLASYLAVTKENRCLSALLRWEFNVKRQDSRKWIAPDTWGEHIGSTGLTRALYRHVQRYFDVTFIFLANPTFGGYEVRFLKGQVVFTQHEFVSQTIYAIREAENRLYALIHVYTHYTVWDAKD